MSELIDLFIAGGGEFLISKEDFIERLSKIKCFLFDWDGVFNDGYHPSDRNSMFSEVDSMAVNLIRFGYWLKNDEQLPLTGIITGQNNEQAAFFAEREHLDFMMLGYKDKRTGLQQILEKYNLQTDEIAFVFDDILDLAISKVAGLRFYINRPASPLLRHYVVEQGMVDYLTECSDNQHGVREVSELLLAGWGHHRDIFKHRYTFSDTYQRYWAERNALTVQQIKKR